MSDVVISNTHTVRLHTSDGGMSSAKSDVNTKGKSSRPTFGVQKRFCSGTHEHNHVSTLWCMFGLTQNGRSSG